MRIFGRRAERLVDALLERLREGVLEPVRLGVDGVELELERAREVELEQPVVAKHLERDPLAAAREPDAAVRLMVDEPARGQLLHHRRRRRRPDSHPPGEGRRPHARAFSLELVDLAQVVLQRVAQVGEPRHGQATNRPVRYMTTMPAR